MKLKSKLRNCDYKLAGTVIKQQYYNESSYTEINRMIDHFMEDPGFDRALDLIGYNEMIVFYFTESCTDGLYVRKAPVDPTKSSVQETNSYEQTSLFAKPPSIRTSDILPDNERTTHSEHLQKIQESEEWMDQMISRLARKPKLPTVTEIPLVAVTPSVKVYNEDEVESFDTIEFKSADSLRDVEVYEEDESLPKLELEKAIEVFYEEDVESTAAFEFVASAESSKLDALNATGLFASSPISEPERKKRPSFPNVVATLKIDLHTMMKQLDEYRYQLAYHPHNEQQMIQWIDSLEKAVDEFSGAIDLIEDSYE